MDFFLLLFSTVLYRPYVFIFLIFFILAGVLTLGAKKTFVLLGMTWVIAFLSEYSSTRIGFPFGDYFYIESTRDREIWVSNVPFMDSLSFTFLAFVSYTFSLFFFLKVSFQKKGILSDEDGSRHSWRVLGLAVLLFVFLDVVIDPLALRGDRWFLGKIFGYASEGVYFGVPLSNFLGWAFVGSTSLFLFQLYDQKSTPRGQVWEVPLRRLVLGPILYYIILIFNLSMTFWIEESLLGVVGIFIHFPILLFFLFRMGELLQFSKMTPLWRPLEKGKDPKGSNTPGFLLHQQVFPFQSDKGWWILNP
jgi:putative membrane protein